MEQSNIIAKNLNAYLISPGSADSPHGVPVVVGKF